MKNFLVKLRSTAFSVLLNIDPTATLNPSQGNQYHDAADTAVELKTAINQLKAEAISPDGQKVDYEKLQNSLAYQNFTNQILTKLATLNLEQLQNQETGLAFWINIYNALTIHGVIAYGIKTSVMEQGMRGFLRFFNQNAYTIGGNRFSLEDIEHGILRANQGNPGIPGPQFAKNDPRAAFVLKPPDPRIHFALNCASVSCPPIGVYAPDHIHSQLDLAARSFIQQTTGIENGRLSVSRIFKWYFKDFGTQKELIAFLTNYLPTDDPRAKLLAANPKNKFHYQAYNWNLNT